MSVSVSASALFPQTPPPAQASSTASSAAISIFAMAPDGDYLQPNYLSQQTPDASGGYKPLSPVSSNASFGSSASARPSTSNSASPSGSPAVTSSPAVQLALTALVKGG